MKEQTFDIFSGGSDKDGVWIDSVEGLSNARERIEQIAAKTPGKYFLFSAKSSSILLRIETFTNSVSSTSYVVAAGGKDRLSDRLG